MINLVKKLLWIKGSVIPLPLLWLIAAVAPSGARAQSALWVSPMETALAGSITARIESPWCARANPAALAAARVRSLHISFTPSSLGIDRYQEGGMLAALPFDSTVTLGATVDALGVPGYREIAGGVMGAIELPGKVALGGTISLHSLAIEGYGSAIAPDVDVGAIAFLTDRITFGAALRNVARSGIAGTELPQRLSFGFAFDLGRGITFSLDGVHELRRGARMLLGISLPPAPGFTIRAGAASAPGMLAFGLGYEEDGTIFDYGGSYTSRLGLRHTVGIGLRW